MHVHSRIGGMRSRPGSVSAVTSWPVGAQRVGDLVPRPRAEPEPGNQDDRCGSHSAILGKGTDITHPSAALTPSRARKSVAGLADPANSPRRGDSLAP